MTIYRMPPTWSPYRLDRDALRALPTLYTLGARDLKVEGFTAEGAPYRIWYVEDGLLHAAPYTNTGEIEVRHHEATYDRPGPSWHIAEWYDARTLAASTPGPFAHHHRNTAQEGPLS